MSQKDRELYIAESRRMRGRIKELITVAQGEEQREIYDDDYRKIIAAEAEKTRARIEQVLEAEGPAIYKYGERPFWIDKDDPSAADWPEPAEN